MIALNREFFAYLLDELKLPNVIEYGDMKIDFGNFREISYVDSIVEIGGIDREIVSSEERLRMFLIEKGVKLEKNISYGKLLSETFDEFVESKLIDPTFVTHYPIAISPLARRSESDSEIADRFELFIGGREIGNGFSELNNPLDQHERFQEQVREKEAGDEEAQYMDEDYVWALSYGMPPTAGQGIGIDRLVMLLTNSKTIKDVLLFPAMKSEKSEFFVIGSGEDD